MAFNIGKSKKDEDARLMEQYQALLGGVYNQQADPTPATNAPVVPTTPTATVQQPVADNVVEETKNTFSFNFETIASDFDKPAPVENNDSINSLLEGLGMFYDASLEQESSTPKPIQPSEPIVITQSDKLEQEMKNTFPFNITALTSDKEKSAPVENKTEINSVVDVENVSAEVYSDNVVSFNIPYGNDEEETAEVLKITEESQMVAPIIETQADNNVVYCSVCGNKEKSSLAFCTVCGNTLNATVKEEVVEQQPENVNVVEPVVEETVNFVEEQPEQSQPALNFSKSYFDNNHEEKVEDVWSNTEKVAVVETVEQVQEQVVKDAADVVYCYKCGNKQSTDYAFCLSCGTKIYADNEPEIQKAKEEPVVVEETVFVTEEPKIEETDPKLVVEQEDTKAKEKEAALKGFLAYFESERSAVEQESQKYAELNKTLLNSIAELKKTVEFLDRYKAQNTLISSRVDNLKMNITMLEGAARPLANDKAIFDMALKALDNTKNKYISRFD